MPTPAKKPGDPVRVIRHNGQRTEIENDWFLVRFEPDSGDLIAEKRGKRITSPRAEYDLLNFPGSAGVWELLCSDGDDAVIVKAKNAWAGLDLHGAIRRLLDYGRALGPEFAGIQTVSDFLSKAEGLKSSCLSSMEVLGLEAKRAQAEYDRAPIGSSFDNDSKDTLLQRLCGIKDRLASREHVRDAIFPAICALADALTSLEKAAGKG